MNSDWQGLGNLFIENILWTRLWDISGCSLQAGKSAWTIYLPSPTTTWLPVWAWESMELLQFTDHMILMSVSDELLTVCKPSTLSQDLVAPLLQLLWTAPMLVCNQQNKTNNSTSDRAAASTIFGITLTTGQALVLDLTTHGGLKAWGPQCPLWCPALPIASWWVCSILPPPSQVSSRWVCMMTLHCQGSPEKKEPIGWIYINIYTHVCMCV